MVGSEWVGGRMARKCKHPGPPSPAARAPSDVRYNGRHKKAFKRSKMFPLIATSGTPRERGRQYGTIARAQVQQSIATYARLFGYCGMAWGEAQMRALAYRDAIAGLSSALCEEIAGIAEGAEVTEPEILALNARTEILPPTYPSEPSAAWPEALARNRAVGVPDWGEC